MFHFPTLFLGLPVEKRSKFYALVASQETSEANVEKLHDRIVKCTKNLLGLIDISSLNQIILGKHLGDLLAALIQLSYAPLKKPTESQESSADGKSNGFVMTPEAYENLKSEQDYFKENLMSVVDKVYQPLIGKKMIIYWWYWQLFSFKRRN